MQQTAPTIKPAFARYEDLPGVGNWCRMKSPRDGSISIVQIINLEQQHFPIIYDGRDYVYVMTAEGPQSVHFACLHPI